MSSLQPCLLGRRAVPKIWGGRAVVDRFQVVAPDGSAIPDGTAIGETWECFDRPDGSSQLLGQGEEVTLADWMRRDPQALLGSGAKPARDNRFPLLIKFIDAAEALSVQVHPDDEQAAEDSDDGKPEAWVVLDAGPKARILHGLRDGVTKAEFEAALTEESPVGGTGGRSVELLGDIRPEPGQAIHVPTGLVHAIGPDVVLYEVQHNSDVTYRLYDWGRDRPMHIEQGMRALREPDGAVSVVEPTPIDAHTEWLVRDDRFGLRRLRATEPMRLSTNGRCQVMTVIEGHASVGWHSGGEHPPIAVRRGESVLIPAVTNEVFVSPIGAMVALVAEPGSRN